MNYLLLCLSVSVNAAYASLHNYLGKQKIKTDADNFFINMLTYGTGTLLLIIYAILSWKGMSAFTLILGVVFGLLTAFAGVFELKALANGPMSFTILITTSSMILPAFSGALIWNESLSILKVIGTVMMIASAYFSAVKGEGRTSLKWLGYCMATFCCSGSIGITQKIQQNSAYADESIPFLAIAFIVATLVCLIFSKVTANNVSANTNNEIISNTKKGVMVPAAICGAFIAFLNVVNLYLSGVLPSALLFPVQNGGTTVLSVLCAVVLFREKMNTRRMIGIGIGMIALILLIV